MNQKVIFNFLLVVFILLCLATLAKVYLKNKSIRETFFGVGNTTTSTATATTTTTPGAGSEYDIKINEAQIIIDDQKKIIDDQTIIIDNKSITIAQAITRKDVSINGRDAAQTKIADAETAKAAAETKIDAAETAKADAETEKAAAIAKAEIAKPAAGMIYNNYVGSWRHYRDEAWKLHTDINKLTSDIDAHGRGHPKSKYVWIPKRFKKEREKEAIDKKVIEYKGLKDTELKKIKDQDDIIASKDGTVTGNLNTEIEKQKGIITTQNGIIAEQNVIIETQTNIKNSYDANILEEDGIITLAKAEKATAVTTKQTAEAVKTEAEEDKKAAEDLAAAAAKLKTQQDLAAQKAADIVAAIEAVVVERRNFDEEEVLNFTLFFLI